MFSFLTGTELRRFRRGLLPKLAVVAMISIPLLYGALYLWAYWDPTGHLDQLPVALVNEDAGATQSDGTAVSAGDRVVTELLDSDTLDWRTTDAADAADGVRDGTYYFAVTIPTEFSTDVVSAGGDDPTPAELQVTYNDANSYLASTLGRSAMTQIRAAVSATIGEQAVDQVLVGLGSARDGFASASDGALTLNAAAGHLADGADQLADGTGAAADGAQRLADGAVTLADGTGRLSTGADQLTTGSSRLSTGASTAASGAAQLSTGARQAADGAGELSTGATTTADGASTLATSAAELSSGTSAATGSASTLATGAAQLSAGVDQLASNLTTQQSALTGLGSSLTAIVGQASAAGDTATADALAQVLTSLRSATGTDSTAQLSALVTGAHQVRDGSAQLGSGLSTLSTGAGQLAEGAQDLADGTGQVADAAAQLAGGTGQVADAAALLADGTSQVATASGQVADGAGTLASSVDTLDSGALTLADGAGQVADGTKQLAGSLAAGAEQIPDDDRATRTQRAETIASPVRTDDSDLASANGYGEGFAPFFIPLALFVGGLITWLLLRPLPSRALATPASGWRTALSGYAPAFLIGIAQVAVLLAVVHLGLGMGWSTAAGTFAFTVLVAAAFLAVQQMLTAVLGSAAGKVSIIILLMLQLTAGSGTYPVETTPGFFQALHPFLPMSYAITGLRELLYGGTDARLWTSVAVLLLFTVGSLAVTAWRAGRMRTWTLSRLHPALSI